MPTRFGVQRKKLGWTLTITRRLVAWLELQTYSRTDAIKVFCVAGARLLSLKGELHELSFDKDNDLMVEFVTAASNLRCMNYDIAVVNRFETKGIAGNIIHAIATTNAIVASQITIEAIKIVSGKMDKLACSYITRHANSTGKYITATQPDDQNPRWVGGGISNKNSKRTEPRPWLVVVHFFSFFLGVSAQMSHLRPERGDARGGCHSVPLQPASSRRAAKENGLQQADGTRGKRR